MVLVPPNAGERALGVLQGRPLPLHRGTGALHDAHVRDSLRGQLAAGQRGPDSDFGDHGRLI